MFLIEVSLINHTECNHESNLLPTISNYNGDNKLVQFQVLVTKADFYNDHTREQLFTTINELLQLNIIPIINTNDAVSPPPDMYEDVDGILGIRDNDSLAARVAVETKADLAILMSDVDGIYDRPPAYENARVMHTFNPKDLNIIK